MCHAVRAMQDPSDGEWGTREAQGNNPRTLTHLSIAGVLVGQFQEAGQVALNLLHSGTLTQDQPIEMEEQGLE